MLYVKYILCPYHIIHHRRMNKNNIQISYLCYFWNLRTKASFSSNTSNVSNNRCFPSTDRLLVSSHQRCRELRVVMTPSYRRNLYGTCLLGLIGTFNRYKYASNLIQTDSLEKKCHLSLFDLGGTMPYRYNRILFMTMS